MTASIQQQAVLGAYAMMQVTWRSQWSGIIATSAVGWDVSTTVKVDEPSASSIVEADGALIVTPATSSSVTAMGPSVPAVLPSRGSKSVQS